MLTVIPTYGRSNRQLTAQLFPRAILCVKESEKDLYPGRELFILPYGHDGIAAARDWIIRRCYPHRVLMLDDDLNFAARRIDDPTKFLPLADADHIEIQKRVDDLLNRYPHVSMSPRQGANRNTDRLLYNGRCMRVHGFNTDVLVREGIRGFRSEAPFMRDFYITLKLLTRGYSNCIINHYVHDHPGSNTVPGGCTGQRTLEALKRSAEVLQSEFPEFVVVEQKQTKHSWEGESRYDVRIQWKRAHLSGAHREANGVDD